MYLSNGHLQPLFIEVPCGHCAECLGLKREQWYLRNYWHCKECFDKGGFVLFDTLTYRDSDLPHLSLYIPEAEGTSWDYPCFSYDHYKNFMKRLRINLSRGVFEDEFIKIKEFRKERSELIKKKKSINADIAFLLEFKWHSVNHCFGDGVLKYIDKYVVGGDVDWYSSYAYLMKYSDLSKIDDLRKKRSELIKRIKDIDYEIECLDAFRKTWKAAENIDAFVVSEYGDEGYYMSDNGKMRKATFRPHYHLLFYNTIPNLDAITLSKYIYKSWGHGRTDCCDLDGNVRVGYVRAHNCIGKNYQRNSEMELRRVSSYVAKYITKDAWYSEKLNQRVQYAAERLIKDVEEYEGDLKGLKCTCYHYFKNQKSINQLKRLVDGFHLQGLGFGLYGIDPKNFDEKQLLEDGTFKMPDKDKLFKHIPAPLYYIRKLYYSVIKPNSKVNSPTYVLKPEGIKWKESSLLRGYKNMCSRYTDLLLNMSEYDKLRVNFLIGDRSIDDYCKYKYFYQNRIYDGYVELDLDKVIKKIVSTKPYGKGYDIYLDKDRDVYVKNGKFSLEGGVYGPCYDVIDFNKYCEDNMINMWSSPEFIYYDWLDDIFDEYIKIDNKKKQELFDLKEQTRRNLKISGIKCKK